jgi:hypothetical protein
MDWRLAFEREMEQAESARQDGNEGRCRVCARRAAGIVVTEYYARQGLPSGRASALDLLRRLHADPNLPPAIAPALEHLLVHVDTEFHLAPGVDLIADARMLRSRLLVD